MSPVLPLRRLSSLSDAHLVDLARTGDERAFETLVCRYRRQLLVYAGRLLGAEGRAEDALQQALMRAWIALRDGAEVDEVRAWLYRIVHNSAVTMLRRARHDCVELNEALDAAAPEGGPESRLAVGELFVGLAALPEPQRQAILLTAGGSSHSEAAEMLGLTDGAVRGLVYRARATLRHAAASLLPFGLLNRIAALGGRRASAAGDMTDAAGVAGSTGLAAAVLKGGAIVASAGALAGAGQAVLPSIVGPFHHHLAAPRQAGPGGHLAARSSAPGTRDPAHAQSSAGASALRDGRAGADRQRGRAERAGSGRGHGGPAGPGGGRVMSSGGSSSGSGSRGGPGPSSSAKGSSGTSGGAGSSGASSGTSGSNPGGSGSSGSAGGTSGRGTGTSGSSSGTSGRGTSGGTSGPPGTSSGTSGSTPGSSGSTPGSSGSTPGSSGSTPGSSGSTPGSSGSSSGSSGGSSGTSGNTTGSSGSNGSGRPSSGTSGSSGGGGSAPGADDPPDAAGAGGHGGSANPPASPPPAPAPG